MDSGTSNAIATDTKAADARAQQHGPTRERRLRPRWPARDRWSGDAAVVAVPALLAGALCLVDLTGRSVGFDESATASIVSQHGAALGHGIAHDGGNMSGYYVLMHALVSLFGSGTSLLRLPSAIAIAVAVALTGVLGLRLFDRRTALVAGLLTAVSVSLVFWGQGARSYALLVAFSCASFLAFVALVSTKDDVVDGGNRRARHLRLIPWIGYVLFTALALYMSLIAALIVVAQVATFAWWWRRRRWAVLSAVAAIGLLSIPLAVLAAGRGSGQVSWVSRPKFVDIEQVLEAITGSGLQPSIHSTATTFPLLWLTVAALIAIATAIVFAWRREEQRRAVFGPTLLLSWLVVPLTIAWVESLVAQPLFLPRNLLYATPAAALLLAWGLTRTTVAPKLALGAVAVLLILRALQVAPSYGVSPEDWRGATAFVLRQTHPGDCAVLYPSDGRMAFQYYVPGRLARAVGRVPRPVVPKAPWSEVRTYVEDYAAPSRAAIAHLPADCRRLWFISTHPGRPHGSPVARADYRRYIRLRAALQTAYGNHRVRYFGYASPVRVELLGGRASLWTQSDADKRPPAQDQQERAVGG
jgi:mannosyltransferase